MSNPKRTISSIISNAKSRDYFETKIGRSFDNNKIKFLSPRNNKGYCQAFDIKTCGLECRIKSYMTYPVCAKHDRPKFVAAIHAKEYLSSMPICSSLSDEFINDLSTYFTERCLDLKRPIEEGMFYVMHRVDIENHPELFKIGLDIGDENCDFEDRISKHEEGFCRAVFAEGYVTPIHSDCRLVDGVIKKLYASDMIPQFIPYNPNRVPSKAEVEEFDANNEKMKSRLAKEDKTKRAEVDKPVDRLKNYWVIDGG
ncbi:unnamed protein product [Rhizophagus irregularis]|nr:unnamed protein product [Rhizophagus irregularis]